MTPSFDIVCFSTSDWDFPVGSRQQIMRRLAGQRRVLFVEYQASCLHPFRYKSLRGRWKKNGALRSVAPSLWVYTPSLSFPFGAYDRRINQWNQRRLVNELKQVLSRLHFTTPLLWTYTPLAADAIPAFGDVAGVVYHALEGHSAERNIWLRQRTLQEVEAELLRRADLVFTMSERRAALFPASPRRICFLPSAVDETIFFRESRMPSSDENGALHRIPSPRLAFAGHLDARKFNIPLMVEVMQQKRDWSLLLIGRLMRGKTAFRELFRLPNVFYLGEQERRRVPQFLREADVCLHPFIVDPFTEGLSTLKIFEYLAVGKPVVSTPLGSFEEMDGLVYVAEDSSSFILQIQKALGEKGDKERSRVEFALQHTWEHRAATVEGLLREVFAC